MMVAVMDVVDMDVMVKDEVGLEMVDEEVMEVLRPRVRNQENQENRRISNHHHKVIINSNKIKTISSTDLASMTKSKV